MEIPEDFPAPAMRFPRMRGGEEGFVQLWKAQDVAVYIVGHK